MLPSRGVSFIARLSSLSSFSPRLFSSSSRIVPKGDIIITKAAKQRLKEILSDNEKLRIEVEGGGCAGFEYKLRLDNGELQGDDLAVQDEGKTVMIVDEMSLEYIRGSTVDYVEELMRTSFRILANPLADKGCSCGSSFSLKGG